MTDLAFDERLTSVLHAYGETAVRPFDADAIATGAMRARRSAWSRWASAPTGRRTVLVLLAALLTAIALGVAFTLGSQREAVPTVPPTALPRPSESIEAVVPTPVAPVSFAGRIARSIDLPSDVFGRPVELSDGRVLFGGGRNSAVLDIDTGSVERVQSGPHVYNAIVLHDGRVLVVDPSTGQNSTSWVEVFDPSTNQLTRLDDVPIVVPGEEAGCCDLHNPAVALLDDGRVLVAGGRANYQGPETPITSAAIFDPATDRFRLLDARMATPLVGATTTTLVDGRVLITGGLQGSDGLTPPDARLFDPATETFRDLGPVPGIGWQSVAVRLDNGRVLLAEAGDRFGDLTSLEAGAAIFDPATDAFAQLPNLPHHPSGAVVLRDGRVLMSSTWETVNDPQGNSLPHPVRGTWTATYDPATAAIEELGTIAPVTDGPLRLADGRVLLIEDLAETGGEPERRVVVYE